MGSSLTHCSLGKKERVTLQRKQTIKPYHNSLITKILHDKWCHILTSLCWTHLYLPTHRVNDFTYNPFLLQLHPEKLSLSNPEFSQTWQNRTIQLQRARKESQKVQASLQTQGADKQLQGPGSSVSTPPFPWIVGNVTMGT